ncbi:hypothetical protein D3OALGA1CA_646 [Olavius algarvensis associated proteobacterium Delta 3]|nr:hypothetical protein D3OALGA1CA_646 [Olavius algarvensis associated proteobacterium Delta 3]CAB5128250.1 hypothetical protein D3OALGB2SA_3432 [Olavius algarvensis associated proteobacterium Delta 3]
MDGRFKLTTGQVARVAGCHPNTVLRYEREGFIESRRDLNNYRRFTRQDAEKLRELLSIRRPADAPAALGAEA